MTEWQKSLGTTLDEAWRRLEAAPADPGLAEHYVTLATIGERGAEARTVVLRHADRSAGRVEIFTDAATAKVRELRHSPAASILTWDAAANVQMRLRATAGLISGEDAAAEWEKLSPFARQNYGVEPVPGTPIAAAEAASRVPDPARFMILRFDLTEIETLYLGRPGSADPAHRRALFDRRSGWQGGWIAP